MPFYGYLTGREYETLEAMRVGEKEAAQREAAQLSPDPFDDPNAPTAEQIRATAEYVEHSNQDAAKNMAEERAAEIFCQIHPEFVQNKRNAAAIEMLLKARGIIDDRYVSVEDIEDAYSELLQRGLIDVDESKLREQPRATVTEQANEIRTARKSRSSGISTRTVSRSVRPSYTDDQLYSMSLEQLRELAMKEAFEG